MSEVLPLLLLPAVLGWWISEIKQRRTRTALRSAISGTRAPMLVDAGVASVVTVARSLEVTPPNDRRTCPWWYVGRSRTTWEVRELAAPLGLALTEVMGIRRDRLGRHAGFVGASRFAGVRHGRAVHVHLGLDASEVHLGFAAGTPLEPFELVGSDAGDFTGSGAVPVPVAAALETLTASRHWRGVTLAAHEAGITLARSAAVPASWLHDLWLAEFVADLANPAAAPDASRASG